MFSVCLIPANTLSAIPASARQLGASVGPFQLEGLAKTEAEEVLDWLEVHGFRDSCVRLDDNTFTIWPNYFSPDPRQV
jgi:hypothetical protein